MENAPSENYIPQSGDMRLRWFRRDFLFFVCAEKRIDKEEECVRKIRRKFMAEKGKPEQLSFYAIPFVYP